MNTWNVLIRREYWEHRGLWLAPLTVAGVLIATSLFALLYFGEVKVGPRNFRFDGEDDTAALAVALFPIAGLMLLVGGLAIGVFLLDCLYAERKDRSILFWKSLPVSDTQTVLAKLAVAQVITPLGLCVLAIITHAICLGMLSLWPPGNMAIGALWDTVAQLRSYGVLLSLTAINMVWFLPLAGYSLLASVLARRSPMLIALLPILLVVLGERLALGTSHAGAWLASRSRPVLDVSDALTNPALWVGAALGAALIVVVIRLRRWRDDS